MFAASPRRSSPSIFFINSFAIRSADGSLQSEVIAFHSTGSRPVPRNAETAGRRAPKAAEKISRHTGNLLQRFAGLPELLAHAPGARSR